MASKTISMGAELKAIPIATEPGGMCRFRVRGYGAEEELLMDKEVSSYWPGLALQKAMGGVKDGIIRYEIVLLKTCAEGE